jgi:hypothetical protein
LSVTQVDTVGQQLISFVDAKHVQSVQLLDGELFAVFESKLMVTGDDQLDFVRKCANCSVKIDDLADV